MTTRGKASLIIGVYATAAIAWSGATAYIPIVGPGLFDTAGLTIISIAMAYSLAALYRIDLDTATIAAFGTCVLGAVFGNVGLKMLAGLVPILGSFVNAGITGTLHTAIGLGLCKIFESGRDLNTVSPKEFRRIIKSCEEEVEAEEKRYNAAYDKLSKRDQERIKALQRQLKRRDLSNSDRDRIQNEVGSIFGFSF